MLAIPVFAQSAFLVFEEFDLAEALLGFLERFVGTTEILALARKNLVTTLHLLDHGRSPSKAASFELARSRCFDRVTTLGVSVFAVQRQEGV